jgi:hypothetical protein
MPLEQRVTIELFSIQLDDPVLDINALGDALILCPRVQARVGLCRACESLQVPESLPPGLLDWSERCHLVGRRTQADPQHVTHGEELPGGRKRRRSCEMGQIVR